MNKAGTTLPVRVIRAAGTIQIAEAVQMATVFAPAGRCVLVAGVLFIAYRTSTHPLAWQFSLSHWGRPSVVVSMHGYKRDAEVQVARVYWANSDRDLRDEAAFAALIQDLAAFGDAAVE